MAIRLSPSEACRQADKYAADKAASESLWQKEKERKPTRMTRISMAEAKRFGIAPAKTGKRGMNKLEQSYATHLACRLFAGEIAGWGFEEIKLKIGAKICWLVVDFHVVGLDGKISFHETKGPYAREDSMIKLKAAALKYPHFRFVLVKANGSGWTTEAIE